MEKIIVFDFAGTLVKAEIIEEANEFRSKVLQRSLPSSKEHSNEEQLYEINRDFVEKLTGLTKNMEISYTQNNLQTLKIDGEKYQNQISTNLFQIGMFMVAKMQGNQIFRNNLINVLQKLKKNNFKIAIVSGVRTDIISGMLQIAKIPIDFDYILGQPPILGISNKENLKKLKLKGKIEFVIGDKKTDILPAKELGLKTIFFKSKHSSNSKQIADFNINNIEDLLDLIS